MKALSTLATLVVAGRAAAAPLLGTPDGGADARLAALAAGFQRQQDVLCTLENGLSLDVVVDAANAPVIRDFFSQQASDDFQQVTGRHPFSVISTFDEWGDEGNFAGIASVGLAARLLVLERDRASATEIAAARAAAVRAARTWHVFGSIAGGGLIARGVRRTRPEHPADPPLPGTLPATVRLADDAGHPLPAVKDLVWREPVAPGFDGWIWLDDTSTDQACGYALAALWLYEALIDDPEAPREVTAQLAADLTAFARRLRDVAPETGLDLSLRDADGRLTDFHDLNPRELVPGSIAPSSATSQNSLNALLALAIVRAAYHVSGDAPLGQYYYDELVAKRRLPGHLKDATAVIFAGRQTNFSNVNMLAIGYATLLRVETDAQVRRLLESAADDAFWDAGSERDALHAHQAWYDVVYAGLSSRADPEAISARVRDDLLGFRPAPTFEQLIVNCDDAELDAGRCIGVDDTTVIDLEPGGRPQARHALPTALRPDSDEWWRSDPFAVNGGGANRIDPRGDFLAAYWLGRLLDRDVTKNRSPHARAWPQTSTPDQPAHCGCAASGDAWLQLAAAAAALRLSQRSRAPSAATPRPSRGSAACPRRERWCTGLRRAGRRSGSGCARRGPGSW